MIFEGADFSVRICQLHEANSRKLLFRIFKPIQKPVLFNLEPIPNQNNIHGRVVHKHLFRPEQPAFQHL